MHTLKRLTNTQGPFDVVAFYRFQAIEAERLDQLRCDLESFAEEQAVGGLIILAEEGINGTVAGETAAASLFQEKLRELFGTEGWNFKLSSCESFPFERFKIKSREEIVTTGTEEGVEFEVDENSYLSPSEWRDVLTSEEDVFLLDTRNWYETELGMFKGAVDPNIVNFQDFPSLVASGAVPKDKKVLMYCTGGIRCEKANILMKQRGYQDVYQLHGGILKYLEEFPNDLFEGECFVFDKRVAVDQELKPSEKYALCPHYGQPAQLEIECERCGAKAKVLERCMHEPFKKTCSKNCANILQREAEVRERRRARAAIST